jgi:heme exporter protein A
MNDGRRELGTPSGPWAVEAVDLARSFGPVWALHRVNLRLAPGQHLALFGPNGAGKTTLLKVLATLLAPTSGTMRILGHDPRTAPTEVRRRIGVVGHRTYLDENLTATENLAFYAQLYDVPRARRRIGEVLELVGLGARSGDRVGALSRGMQQRATLARAVLHDPDLLLLDEPDTGLDAGGLEALVAAVERPGPPRTLIVASHHPDRAARLAPRALWLTAGRVVADGPTLPLAGSVAGGRALEPHGAVG